MKTILGISGMAALLALASCSAEPGGAANEVGVNQAGLNATGGAQSFNAVVKDDALTKMFEWWNDAYTKTDGFTAEAFSEHFTDDAVMRINGKVSARGVTDLASHFREIQKKTEKVKINLPFIASFSSPDGSKIYTYHTIDAAADGKPSFETVTGYAELRDGKIALIDFLSIDGKPADDGS